jgi:hypothetical protein
MGVIGAHSPAVGARRDHPHQRRQLRDGIDVVVEALVAAM